MASSNNNQQSDASSNTVTRSNRTDIGWKFCHTVIEGDTNVVQCNFCGKIMKGGITRAKEHLMRKPGNVSPCPSCPKEVKEELEAHVKNKKKKEIEANQAIQRVVQDIDISDEEEVLKELEAQTPSSASERKNVALKGPIDLYCRRPESAIAKNRKNKLKQTSIREACDKEATTRVH